jgi:hypothetical protein
MAAGFQGSPLLPGMLAPAEVSNLRPGFLAKLLHDSDSDHLKTTAVLSHF